MLTLAFVLWITRHGDVHCPSCSLICLWSLYYYEQLEESLDISPTRVSAWALTRSCGQMARHKRVAPA